MKKLVLLTVLATAAGQCPLTGRFQDAWAAPVAPATDTLSNVAARADFDLMRLALEEAHTGLYRYSSKSEMDQAFDAQRAKLNRSTTRSELFPIFLQTLATIHCGHTNIKPDDQTRQIFANARTLPLRMMIEGQRLMVVFNDTPANQTILPGMEIVEINGHRPADLLNRFMPFVSGDGDVESGKRHDLTNRFALYYHLLIEQTEEFTVKATDASGKTVVARLAGVTDAERKNNHNTVNAAMKAGIEKVVGGSPENQSLRFLNDPDIALIRLRYFVGDSFPQWVEDTFKSLREKKTKSLIIDLRGNGGGEDMYGAMLVSYLTDKPFRYFDHINVKTFTPSFKEHSNWNADEEAHLREVLTPNPAGGFLVSPELHKGVAEQQPGKYPFLGRVYVLIEGGTFSTAADFCAVTHHLKRATFIGEETGGGYYGNNSGMETILTLPNSGFQIRLPMYEYWNAVPGYEGKRRGTIPDHPVPVTTADALQGVDRALDLAIKLATTK